MSGIMSMLLGAVSSAAAAVDEFFNRVTLLLPGNGTNGAQNNTFLDSSSNNFTITRNGNTTQGTFSPFSQTGWSNYFDGTGDYLQAASGSSTSFGTGDFCVECWFYKTSSASTGGYLIANLESNSDAQWALMITSTDVIRWQGWNTLWLQPAAPAINQWNHVAVCRSGTTLSMFINGSRAATVSSHSNNYSATTNVRVGAYASGTDPFTGYISNARVVKGSSVYDPSLTTCTVPTAPLTAITNTSFLTCQSNRFIDNSSNAFTITVNGNPSIQAFSPFAPTAAYSAATVGGSGYFDGTGDYLSVADNAALDMGSSSFTMEFWTYLTGTPSTYQAYISKRANTGTYGGVSLYLTSGRALNLQATLNGSSWGVDITTSSTVTLNSWTHVAVVRNGDAWAVYINGASGASTTVSGTVPDNSSAFMIGAGAADGSHPIIGGYIGDFRVVKGTAVYTGAFTPPTAPLTAITNTSLLTNFTNAGITDATAKNDLETVGNAQISTTQSKFGGSSMYFDGTGDWLTVIDNPNLQMGSGDFTIEGWFYLSATGVAYGIASKGTSTTGWSVNITSGNKLQFSYTSSNLTGATTLSSATWYYFAVVRSGTATGNLKVYLNGSADATSAGAVTDNFNQTNIMYIGADRVGGSALNGYIDDLRITKGFARTIATPSSAFPLQ